MSEKRTISGVRTDLSPSEFSAKIDSTTPKGQAKKSKAKKFFGNLGEVLSSLGFIPVLKPGSSTSSKVYRGHSAPVHHSGNSFKESYRVDPPRRPTHEDMVVAHMAHDAYMDLVDGKGDHDCGHEH